MYTFPFLFHDFQTEYPDNVPRVQFGRSYQFASRPTAPDQRTFTLSFKGMAYKVYKAGFDSARYLTDNPDVVEYWTESAYLHFMMHGLYEGRPVTVDGVRVDSTEFSRCAGCLEIFYQYHGLWRTFAYAHPTAGSVVVKFSKPLVLSEHAGVNTAVLAPFTVSLVEQP